MRGAQPTPSHASELAQRKEYLHLIGTNLLCLLAVALVEGTSGLGGNLGLFRVEIIIKAA